MDLYLLDGLFRRYDVVDDYISLIWTERFKGYGDFELQIESTRTNRARFALGTNCVIIESNYVMTIDKVERKEDEAGTKILIVKGHSLEYLLLSRPAIAAVASLDVNPEWEISGRPSDIMNYLFDRICRDLVISPYDTIPFLVSGTFLPPGNIDFPQEPISMRFEPGDLYTAIKRVADIWSLGFRLVRNHENNSVYFDVYSGNNRTSTQSTKSPVVFSQELDNLTDTTELTSNEEYKNVAHVLYKTQAKTVVWPNTPVNASGFNRRSMIVKVDSIEEGLTPLQIAAILEQKGLEALSKTRAFVAFDGKTPESGGYVYNKHYELGDLVEKRNIDGLATNLRVAEQIFACDQEGEKRYPGLELEMTINPGTWLSWSSTEEWINATGTWAEA